MNGEAIYCRRCNLSGTVWQPTWLDSAGTAPQFPEGWAIIALNRFDGRRQIANYLCPECSLLAEKSMHLPPGSGYKG
jgi:hypothetical protein